jgi:hypothetical protein
MWMSFQQIAVDVLEGLLGLFSAYTAYSLFAQTPPSIQKGRDALRYPRWYWVLAGCLAALGAIGLFVGLAIPTVGVIAAAWMAAYFVVAMLTHVIRADFKSLGMPLIFLLVFVGLVYLRWSDATPVLSLVGLA